MPMPPSDSGKRPPVIRSIFSLPDARNTVA
jgi:hypothetical protein